MEHYNTKSTTVPGLSFGSFSLAMPWRFVTSGKDRFTVLVSALILMTVFRGLIPLISNGGVPATVVYKVVSSAAILMSGYGFYLSRRTQHSIPVGLSNLLVCNLVFFFFWGLVEYLSGRGIFDSSFNPIMFALVPYSVFVFSRLSHECANRLLVITTVGLCASVFYDFALLNTTIIANGLRVFEQNSKLLRQDGQLWLTRTGVVVRANGITGSAHDTACLLAMLLVFWFVKFVKDVKNRLLSLSLLTISGFALFSTGSAANIVSAGFGGAAVVILSLAENRRRTLRMMVTISVFLALVLVVLEFTPFDYSSGFVNAWLTRIGPNGAWADMLKVGFKDMSIIETIFWGLAGHSLLFGLIFDCETAMLQFPFQFGIASALVLYIIFAYPLIIFSQASKDRRMFLYPWMAAAGTGFLTLSHYSSLLRSTDIYLFYLIFAFSISEFAPGSPQKA